MRLTHFEAGAAAPKERHSVPEQRTGPGAVLCCWGVTLELGLKPGRPPIFKVEWVNLNAKIGQPHLSAGDCCFGSQFGASNNRFGCSAW